MVSQKNVRLLEGKLCDKRSFSGAPGILLIHLLVVSRIMWIKIIITCKSLNNTDDDTCHGDQDCQRDSRRDAGLHRVVLRLRDALGVTKLWPIPVSCLVTPSSPLPDKNITRFTIELNLGPGGERKSRFSSVCWDRQLAAGYYLKI